MQSPTESSVGVFSCPLEREDVEDREENVEMIATPGKLELLDAITAEEVAQMALKQCWPPYIETPYLDRQEYWDAPPRAFLLDSAGHGLMVIGFGSPSDLEFASESGGLLGLWKLLNEHIGVEPLENVVLGDLKYIVTTFEGWLNTIEDGELTRIETKAAQCLCKEDAAIAVYGRGKGHYPVLAHKSSELPPDPWGDVSHIKVWESLKELFVT